MSDILTIDPFKHGSFTHVANIGLTGEETRIRLAKPDITGDYVTVPKHTAFFAYRRVLGIAKAHADGWEAENFQLMVGNSDIKVGVNTRNPSLRTVKWVTGRHIGAEYEIKNCGSNSPVIGEVKSYGPQPRPTDAGQTARLHKQFLDDARAAFSLPTQILCHRIYRQIPAGLLVRLCINKVVKYRDEPDVDKAIQVAQLMSLTGIRDPAAWICPRLRPIEQLAA